MAELTDHHISSIRPPPRRLKLQILEILLTPRWQCNIELLRQPLDTLQHPNGHIPFLAYLPQPAHRTRERIRAGLALAQVEQ